MQNVDLDNSASDEKSTFLSINTDEIALDNDDDENDHSQEVGVRSNMSETVTRLPELKLPAPKSKPDHPDRHSEVPEEVTFIIDSTPDQAKTDNPAQKEEEHIEYVPTKKMMKRRNHAIYGQLEDK